MKASVWDLLIDYDRPQDVPGMVEPRPSFWATPEADDCGAVAPIRCLHVVDGMPDVERCHTIITRRLARAGYEIRGWNFAASTNGWHLKIGLNPHPAPLETVALQAICGSDPLRESCNVARAREVERWARQVEEGGTDSGREAAEFWRRRWNVLYQPNPQRKVNP